MTQTGIAALSILCAVHAYALEVEGFEPDTEVVYKTVGETNLHLSAFAPPDHKPSDKRPAIVFFFGGGWNGARRASSILTAGTWRHEAWWPCLLNTGRNPVIGPRHVSV